MDSIQRSFANQRRSGFSSRQEIKPQDGQWLGCRNLELIKVTPEPKGGKSK
jgi:hypothetical protein